MTLTQYTAFLNAVAQTDPYHVYNPNLAADVSVAGIQQSGLPGSYTYSVIGDGLRPVTYVSWVAAARFTNWLANGQPTTEIEDATTTETGAYTLDGEVTGEVITANPGALWRLPTEDEWYKAAYYDPSLNNGSGGYWTYATRSNSTPGNSWADRALANEANYYTVDTGYTTFADANVGFRVATVPEPNSLMLVGLGSVILATLRRKHRQPYSNELSR